MKTRGFTLMELLIVLAVGVTFAGIGIPVARSVLAKSRQAACLNHLRSLGVSLESYLQDHQQTLPILALGRSSKADESPVLETVLMPYVENPETFKCPQDQKEFGKTGSSYLWNTTQNGLHISKLWLPGIENRPDKIPLIIDKEAWHPDGANYLYADQTVSNKARFAAGNSPAHSHVGSHPPP